MLDELKLLLEAVPQTDATLSEYRTAIVDENCLGKPTMAARNEAIKRLRKEYCLDFKDPLFAFFHKLWTRNQACRALLGFQYAWVNDALLRASCAYFLPMTPGTTITPQQTSQWVQKTYPDTYSEKSIKSVGRSVNSSWYQGGFIEGVRVRMRKQVVPEIENVVFALYLGVQADLAGQGLFTSPMAAVLDSPFAQLIDLAEQGGRTGLIRFKHIGDVIEVSFAGGLS